MNTKTHLLANLPRPTGRSALAAGMGSRGLVHQAGSPLRGYEHRHG
jgi:hypothetical protein